MTTIKIGTRVWHVADNATGRIVWANAAAVRIQLDDGEKVTWKRGDLRSKGLEVFGEKEGVEPRDAEVPSAEQSAGESAGAAAAWAEAGFRAGCVGSGAVLANDSVKKAKICPTPTAIMRQSVTVSSSAFSGAWLRREIDIGRLRESKLRGGARLGRPNRALSSRTLWQPVCLPLLRGKESRSPGVGPCRHGEAQIKRTFGGDLRTSRRR